MSNYNKMTMHPITGAIEEAVWLDNYYGDHKYGVQFSDGSIFREEKLTLIAPEKKMEIRTTKVAVVSIGEPLFSDGATSIEIVDESGGEYLLITQNGEIENGIAIEAEEWPAIKSAIEKMMASVRP